MQTPAMTRKETKQSISSNNQLATQHTTIMNDTKWLTCAMHQTLLFVVQFLFQFICFNETARETSAAVPMRLEIFF